MRLRILIVAAAAGLVVALVVATAFAVYGPDMKRTQRVAGGGDRVVRVELKDIDVDPGVLVVDSGTRLVLDVVNVGAEDHDLAVDGGRARTRVLAAGESERLDLGRVTGAVDLVCTLPLHETLGMTLDVRPAPPASA